MNTLFVQPDGTIICQHTEAIDLNHLGRQITKRATNVEFHNEHQAWKVKDLTGFPMFSAPTRSGCLDWEHQYVDSILEKEGFQHWEEK